VPLQAKAFTFYSKLLLCISEIDDITDDSNYDICFGFHAYQQHALLHTMLSLHSKEMAFERPPRPNVAEIRRWVRVYYDVIRGLRRAMAGLYGKC